LFYAWDQIFHHMLIFITMLLSFGLAGVFIFGRGDPAFAEIGLAVTQCFKIMLGDFDTDKYTQDNPLTAFFWFYSFTVIIAFLMTNCLMAIVMDVYVEVKAGAVNVQTVWDHSWEMLKDLTFAHSVVSIKVVMAAVEKHIPRGESSKVDADVLTKLVPGMSERQSIRLVTEAIERMKEEEHNGQSLTNALALTGSINVMVHKLLAQLDVLLQRMVAQRDKFRVVEELVCRSDVPKGPVHLQCQAFDDRRAAIETAMTNLERFLEDCACWDAYRTLEMHEQLSKIQDGLEASKKKREGEPPPPRNEMPAPEPSPPEYLRRVHGEVAPVQKQASLQNEVWAT